jgi:hypothetical protein
MSASSGRSSACVAAIDSGAGWESAAYSGNCLPSSAPIASRRPAISARRALSAASPPRSRRSGALATADTSRRSRVSSSCVRSCCSRTRPASAPDPAPCRAANCDRARLASVCSARWAATKASSASAASAASRLNAACTRRRNGEPRCPASEGGLTLPRAASATCTSAARRAVPSASPQRCWAMYCSTSVLRAAPTFVCLVPYTRSLMASACFRRCSAAASLRVSLSCMA